MEGHRNYILVQNGISYPYPSELFNNPKMLKSQLSNRLQAVVGDKEVEKVWAKFMQDHKLT